MSIRTSLLALASIAALATAALAPTSASAYAGRVHFGSSGGHAFYSHLYTRQPNGPPFIPSCGHVGCNMKW
jgi:hypothetical protein